MLNKTCFEKLVPLRTLFNFKVLQNFNIQKSTFYNSNIQILYKKKKFLIFHAYL